MIKGKRENNSRGFTMIEMILVVALIGIISGIGLPLFNMMSGSNDLDVAENMLVASLRRAEVLAAASQGDSEWGVGVVPGAFVLFKGSTYATRDVGFDEVYDITDSIQTSGMTEVVFSKMSGVPHFVGGVTLTSPGGETKQITVNEKGKIDF
ncbi:MAG: prepilin-type N-terminal cleavage/methylation domain-containing protein [Candidatus Pacebacteria bacterium]|nr:prepilin-type N-terminal cleavage/methylation domain-containing protein [Candidatus Paceibacterota bacterium]MBP9851500.1 prepilin-type N-terminal cleavage/methylation domain-containing protein [Candidatus Paceibacterota bacterium]